MAEGPTSSRWSLQGGTEVSSLSVCRCQLIPLGERPIHTMAITRQGITSNQELSQKPPESVMQYMISQGVKPILVAAQGFGDS